MRLEWLKITGNSEATQEQISFASDKLNLLLACQGAFENAAILDVVILALYQPCVENREQPPGVSGCELEVSVGGDRSVTVTCDFASSVSDIISGGERCNYAKPAGHSLCGVDVSTFEEIAVIDLNDYAPARSLVRADRVSSLLHRALHGQLHPEQAKALIVHALDNYQFQGRTYKIGELICAMERGQELLQERLQRLEQEKDQSDEKQVLLGGLESEIADRESILKRQEQLQMSKDLSSLDRRILLLQEQAARHGQLSVELHNIGDLSEFPADAVSQVDELWSKRASTMTNHAELSREVSGEDSLLSSSFSAENDLRLEDDWQPDDVPILYNLAGTLANVQSELDDLTLRHANEMRRVKDAGVDFDKVSRTRQAVLSMNARDLDDANNLVGLLKATKQKLSDAVQVSQRIETDVNEARLELTNAMLSERRWRSALLWLSVSPVAFLIAIVAFPYSGTLHGSLREQLITVLITISITAFVFSTFVFVLLHGVKRSRCDRLTRLSKESEQYAQAEAALGQDLTSVYRKADLLARSYNASSGAELLKRVIGYAGNAEQLKDLDLLEQLMFVRQKQKDKLTGEIEQYFKKARRSVVVITPQIVSLLADDIQRFHERLHETEKLSTSLSNKRRELRFLAGEIADTESQLRDAFYRARLDTPEDLSQSIIDFKAKTRDYRRFLQIQEELSVRSQEPDLAVAAESIDAELETLIAERKEVNARLQGLLRSHPSLMEIAVEELSSPSALDEVTRQVKVLQLEYSQCQDTMRSSLRKFHDLHPGALNELEVLQRSLRRVNREKQAAELAISVLERVAERYHLQWSEELTEKWRLICSAANKSTVKDDLLEKLGIRDLRWDEELEIHVGLFGTDMILGEIDLLGEHRDLAPAMDLIIHLVVALTIAPSRRIPMFLNEPFAKLDDSTALALLRLLLQLTPELQITILTAQHERYFQLAAQLEEPELSLIHQCR